MIRTGIFNKEKDIKEVDQVGYIDVGEAIRNGYIPGSMEADDMVYNDIEDPSSIMRNASDVFEMYRNADYIKGFTKSDVSETSSKTPEV